MRIVDSMSTKPLIDDVHRLAHRLAAEADCDDRTALRAIEQGSAAIRGRVGYRVARAMAALGITDPAPALEARRAAAR